VHSILCCFASKRPARPLPGSLPCSEGIVLVDVAADKWPVVFCNDAWEHLTGFDREELGKGFWEHFSVRMGG